MTVPADEPQTSQDRDPEDDGRSAGLAPVAAGLPAMNSGGGGAGVPLLAGLVAADDDGDTADEQARDAGEREVGGTDGPVGGTALPR